MSKVKIGKIAYTNVLPVFYFFGERKFAGEISIIDQVPAELNRQMKAGSVDIGPISSFAYAENDGAYRALADLSVSAKGAVGSIFLFSKKPMQELKEPVIALTHSSATSVNLLKILLEKFSGAFPSYQTMAPDLPAMMEKADAALLIGDDALKGKWHYPHYHIYDLGELWYKHTGMWMTFALWSVRKETIEAHGGLLQEIHHEFLRAKKQGITALDEIILYSQSEFGGDYGFWKQYFLGLNYDLKVDQIKGLEYYFRCAADIGLLSQAVEVQVWGAGIELNTT